MDDRETRRNGEKHAKGKQKGREEGEEKLAQGASNLLHSRYMIIFVAVFASMAAKYEKNTVQTPHGLTLLFGPHMSYVEKHVLYLCWCLFQRADYTVVL